MLIQKYFSRIGGRENRPFFDAFRGPETRLPGRLNFLIRSIMERP